MVAQLSVLSGQRITAVTAVLQVMEQLRGPAHDAGTPADVGAFLRAVEKATVALAQTTARQVVEQNSMEAGDIELFQQFVRERIVYVCAGSSSCRSAASRFGDGRRSHD